MGWRLRCEVVLIHRILFRHRCYGASKWRISSYFFCPLLICAKQIDFQDERISSFFSEYFCYLPRNVKSFSPHRSALTFFEGNIFRFKTHETINTIEWDVRYSTYETMTHFACVKIDYNDFATNQNVEQTLFLTIRHIASPFHMPHYYGVYYFKRSHF